MCNPLVSVYVKLYNNVQYVDDCLISVFNQTYSPLEIVIVDDGSSDGAYERAKELVESCQKRENARCLIRLYRNEQNLGIAQNAWKCLTLCTGEICVQVDGDDVCLPNRVERIVDAWRKSGGGAFVAWHGYWKIDSKNRIIGRGAGYDAEGNAVPWPFGAVMAYSKGVDTRFIFEQMSPPPREVYDDWVIMPRLLRMEQVRILRIPEPLLFYRLGGASTQAGRQARIRGATTRLESIGFARQELNDLLQSGSARVRELQRLFDEKEKFSKNQLLKYGGKTIAERWQGMRSELPSRGRWFWLNPVFWMEDVPLLLSPSLAWLADWLIGVKVAVVLFVKRIKWRHVHMERIVAESIAASSCA